MTKLSKYKKRIFLVLINVVIALIFCFPYLNGNIRAGSDVSFHMNRIEALKESIEVGNFYPYVYLNQNFGYGYGTPSFYGQVFLYPFAFLRMFGLSPAWTWRILVFVIIYFASLSVSYTYEKIFKDESLIASVLVSTLYLFNADTLSRIYVRGAIGEGFALIFIPLIILNIHRYIKEDADNYIGLGVSFACLLLSHNISFIIMIIVFAITILFNIKEISKDKLITLFKATFLGGLLSLFFIFPMIEQLNNRIYFINRSISKKKILSGMKLREYFSFIINDKDGDGIGLGPALLFIPLINVSKRENNYLMITGYILLFVSSSLFPWKYLSILGFIQFATRLITIALSYLALYSTYGLINSKNSIKKIFNISLYIITVAIFIVGCYGIYNSWGAINDSTSSNAIKTGEKLFANWNKISYSVSETSGVEYLPQNNDYDYRNNYWLHYAYDENNNLYPVFYVDNYDYSYIINPNNHKTLTFARIFYSGYVVDVYENENYVTTLQTRIDNKRNAFVSIDIPEEYRNKDMQYVLRYGGTKIQKISIIISVIALTFTLYLIIMNKKQKYKII